jgi:hypothetical protein
MKVFHYHRCRSGHTLVELWVAMIAGTVLLAGLGSVMLIARQVAYTPSAAMHRTEAANLLSQLTDELQFATQFIAQGPSILEFTVNDRNADGTAERIRYEWSGASGDKKLRKTFNGSAATVVVEEVEDCLFDVRTLAVAGPPAARTFFTHAQVRLQIGTAGHARLDVAIPLLSRPERLASAPSLWRTDFNINPTTLDSDRDGNPDWVAGTGATFASTPAGPGQLTNGTWHANGDLKTSPPSGNTAAVTVIAARCKNMASSGAQDVLRVDRESGAYIPLIVRMQRQLDGSQSLTLLMKPTSSTEQILKILDNLTDNYVRFQLTILPSTNQVSLQINDASDTELGGPFTYAPPAATDRYVKIGGNAKFDYVDVRVGAN